MGKNERFVFIAAALCGTEGWLTGDLAVLGGSRLCVCICSDVQYCMTESNHREQQS